MIYLLIKRRSSLQNLVILGFLLILVNQIYQPVVQNAGDSPRTIVDQNDIMVSVETPTNVLSGTMADIKIIMNNPKKMAIIIKSIEFSYGDYDTSTLYKSNIMYELELHDSYEQSLRVPIPEIYQLYRISETDIPISCTVAIRYTEGGVEQWTYTSYNMQIFDRFLDTENTERVFNGEPAAIT